MGSTIGRCSSDALFGKMTFVGPLAFATWLIAAALATRAIRTLRRDGPIESFSGSASRIIVAAFVSGSSATMAMFGLGFLPPREAMSDGRRLGLTLYFAVCIAMTVTGAVLLRRALSDNSPTNDRDDPAS